MWAEDGGGVWFDCAEVRNMRARLRAVFPLERIRSACTRPHSSDSGHGGDVIDILCFVCNALCGERGRASVAHTIYATAQ